MDNRKPLILAIWLHIFMVLFIKIAFSIFVAITQNKYFFARITEKEHLMESHEGSFAMLCANIILDFGLSILIVYGMMRIIYNKPIIKSNGHYSCSELLFGSKWLIAYLYIYFLLFSIILGEHILELIYMRETMNLLMLTALLINPILLILSMIVLIILLILLCTIGDKCWKYFDGNLTEMNINNNTEQ